jgi:hypothetical protein
VETVTTILDSRNRLQRAEHIQYRIYNIHILMNFYLVYFSSFYWHSKIIIHSRCIAYIILIYTLHAHTSPRQKHIRGKTIYHNEYICIYRYGSMLVKAITIFVFCGSTWWWSPGTETCSSVIEWIYNTLLLWWRKMFWFIFWRCSWRNILKFPTNPLFQFLFLSRIIIVNFVFQTSSEENIIRIRIRWTCWTNITANNSVP